MYTIPFFLFRCFKKVVKIRHWARAFVILKVLQGTTLERESQQSCVQAEPSHIAPTLTDQGVNQASFSNQYIPPKV